MNEKNTKKAMSGTLLAFGTVFSSKGKSKTLNIGQFTNQIVRFGRGVGELKRSTYYFAAEGPDAGGGRLTAGMATSAILYIRKIIRGDRGYYKGPEMQPLEPKYAAWKNKMPKFRGKPIMMLTGSTADALGIIRHSGGGVAIGIRSNFFVDPADVGDGRKKKVRVRDYALSHELGIGKPHRPIISGSMASWIGETSDDWAEAFNNMMYQSFWAMLKERDPLEVEEGFVSSDGGGSKSTTEIASDTLQVANWMDKAAKNISAMGQSLLKATARGAKASAAEGKTISPKSLELTRQMLRTHLKGGGLKSDEIEQVIEAAITGKVIDFEDY